ncbi:MAG TPA: DUF5908 family protein [Parapedobacter sp.]|uniref:DUF5908 family protein n=1 Tax=Parapedobacter sp. TaxID=1958893 RepID=UPI002C8697C3|nr:DUF5908 family protein [Parapedobacter sp.]HWK57459.1 DUF5908 family protein [Parapedobacter sp.]
MPIIIKEIVVKTTVERKQTSSETSTEWMKQIREAVAKELSRQRLKHEKWRWER